MDDIVLINGPFKMQHISLKESPKRIQIGDLIYSRIDDPDTGKSLGGYFLDARLVETKI